jgi:hypothetical protein
VRPAQSIVHAAVDLVTDSSQTGVMSFKHFEQINNFETPPFEAIRAAMMKAPEAMVSPGLLATAIKALDSIKDGSMANRLREDDAGRR